MVVMKKTLMIIGLAFVLLLAGCTQSQSKAQNGRVIFTIADVAQDLGSITSVKVTIDSVMVQSTTQGWVTVSSTPKIFDLLQLKASGTQALLADVNVSNDTYNQVRLVISKVVVTDATGDHEAKLPSGDLKIVGAFDANGNSTSVVAFDFVADESIHVTGNGKYILAPIIHLQTRENADVNVNSDTDVEVKSGKVKTDTKVGMDEKGNVGVDIRFPANAVVTIDDATGVITVNVTAKSNAVGNGRFVVGITDKAANLSAVSSVKVTVDSIMVQNASGGWVTLSTTQKTYDLLQLQGIYALAADVQVNEGTYGQIRLQISKVVVTDATGDHEAKLPSGDLRIVGTTVVNANSTSTELLDFSVNDSLHVTGNGMYILAPVVKVETRDGANVTVKTNNEIEINGGSVRANVTVGMDENGTVDANARIPADADISIDIDGKIHNSGKGSPKVNVSVSVGD